MKLLLLSALAQSTLIHAHYTFPELFHNGIDYAHWRFVRKWGSSARSYYTNYMDDFTPLPYPGIDTFDVDGNKLPYPNMGSVVNTKEMRCNFNATPAAETLVIQAGDELGFHVSQKNFQEESFNPGYTMYHPGPLSVWLGKVPEGKTAQTWEGEGKTWFKIYDDLPYPRPDPEMYDNSHNTWPVWPNTHQPYMSILIPPSTPSGEYLFRIEQIQLDIGPQFYISCAQIRIENGGNGVPGPLVEIPGHYDPEDAIWKGYKLFYHVEAPTQPWETRNAGPPVWTG